MKNSKMDYGIKFTAPHELSGMPKDTHILLALSGGADSRALFDLLMKYTQIKNESKEEK